MGSQSPLFAAVPQPLFQVPWADDYSSNDDAPAPATNSGCDGVSKADIRTFEMHTDEERQFWMVKTRELLSALSTGDRLHEALQQQRTEQTYYMDLLKCILLPIYGEMLERLDKLKSSQGPPWLERAARDLRGLFLERAKERFKALHEFLPRTGLTITESNLLRLVRNANAHAQVHFSSNKLDQSCPASVIREVFNEDYAVGDNEVFLYNRRSSDGRVDMILWCPVDLLTAVLSDLVQDWKECCKKYANVGESVVSPLCYTTTPSSEETSRRRAWRASSIARMSAARECKTLEAEYLKACEKKSIDLLTAAKEAIERALTASSKELESSTRKHGDATAEAEYESPSPFDD